MYFDTVDTIGRIYTMVSGSLDDTKKETKGLIS